VLSVKPKFLTDPVCIYLNARDDRQRISRDYRGRTVIYQRYNNINGQTYIGSGVCGSTRLSRYFFKSVLATSSPVYLNILQYGHGAFSVAILEDLGPTGSVSNTEMLAREQFYINLLMLSPLTCLNANPVAGSSTGYKHKQAANDLIAFSRLGKPLSQETKDLLSSMFSGTGNPFAGQTHSEATRSLMSANCLGALNPMFGKPKSPGFLAMQNANWSGANNPQFGVEKTAATIAKLTRLV